MNEWTDSDYSSALTAEQKNTLEEWSKVKNKKLQYCKDIQALIKAYEAENLSSSDGKYELAYRIAVLFDQASQEIADVHGAFPYDDFLQNKQTSPFTYVGVGHIYKTIVEHIQKNNFSDFKNLEKNFLNHEDILIIWDMYKNKNGII